MITMISTLLKRVSLLPYLPLPSLSETLPNSAPSPYMTPCSTEVESKETPHALMKILISHITFTHIKVRPFQFFCNGCAHLLIVLATPISQLSVISLLTSQSSNKKKN